MTLDVQFQMNLTPITHPPSLTNYGTATTLYMWTNEFKIKTKPSHVTFKFTTRSIVRFNPQTMQMVSWKDGVTVWQSIGRFFVNNILMFDSAWCLVMAQTQFSVIKKIKIGSPEDLLPPTLLRSTTSNFCLAPTPHLPQNGRHMCITSYKSKSNHLDNCCYYKKLENAPSYFSVNKK